MNLHNSTLLLGAHVSVSGGLDQSIYRGESIGCTAIQIFTKSNRQWHSKNITDEQANIFKETLKKSSIKEVVVHASYLINIGAANKEINDKSFESLKEELERCEKLGLKYLVLHPGNYQKNSEIDCLKKIAENLNNIFIQVPGNTTILLENMAGMGTSIGYKFENLANIIAQIKDKKRIGICFDTCHAFAAGYNFNNRSAYDSLWNEIKSILDLKLIKVMHINDSKNEIGSRLDRHEFIGKGKIGINSFELLFNDERFFDIPKILETPVDTLEDYKKDLQLIVNLLEDKNKYLIKNNLLEQYLIKKGIDDSIPF